MAVIVYRRPQVMAEILHVFTRQLLYCRRKNNNCLVKTSRCDYIHGKFLPAKTFFAGKNYFCQSSFHHGKKPVFSTDWQKLANPVLTALTVNIMLNT